MGKQDLINAAEASGLSRVPIVYVGSYFLFIYCLSLSIMRIMVFETGFYVLRPEKEKGKRGHFGSSSREWYSGWSCMKTLITKGLVVKSSCPAKYGHQLQFFHLPFSGYMHNVFVLFLWRIF